MALTPVEIRHVHLRRGFRGYRRRAVDALLEDVAASFEHVWRERADLADRVEALETVDEAGTDRRCASVGESTGEIRRLIS